MMKSPGVMLIVLAGALAGCSSGRSDFASWSHYGLESVGSDESAVGLANVDFTSNEPIVVSGVIEEVCTVKGCWMNIRDGGKTARVRFKDYAFFVPRNAAGRRVVVAGRGEMTLLDVAWAKHLAEEAGKSRAEIDAITEPVEMFEIQATAVYIEGKGLDAPYSDE